MSSRMLSRLPLFSFKRLPRSVSFRNLFEDAKTKEERRARILSELKKGYLPDLKEVRATGGKRYLALSEPVPREVKKFSIIPVKKEASDWPFPSNQKLVVPANVKIESFLLPSICGDSLTGKAVDLPHDTLGNVCLLLLWTRNHGQRTCESYREMFIKKFQNAENTKYYEVNIIDSWVFRMMKTYISNNLRNQVPPERQENFLCCYNNSSKIIQAIFENTLVGHVVLVDHVGYVRWKAHGTATDEELMHLVNCTNTLRNEIPRTKLAVG